MKKCWSCFFILLAGGFLTVLVVPGATTIAEVSEKGMEGDPAVISCPYTVGYKTSPKSFCKGVREECETLLKTNGRDAWTLNRKMTLHDNRQKNILVVTINNLSLEDTGRYGCGVETPELHLFTVVHLAVMKERYISAVTHIAGSVTDSTGSSPQPTEPQSLSGFWGICVCVGVVFIAILLSVIFCVFKRRLINSSTETTPSENIKAVCVYDVIQRCDPAQHNASQTPDVPPGPDFKPACATVYSSITIQKEAPHVTNILPADQVSCSTEESRAPAENLTELNYCCVEFPVAGDVRLSGIKLERRVGRKGDLTFLIELVTNANEELASRLVTNTKSFKSVSLSLHLLEVELFMVGPNVTSSKAPRLNTSHASLEIHLVGLSKKNEGKAVL